MSDPIQNYQDIVELMTVVAQLEEEQTKIVAALPALHDKLEGADKANFEALSERANNIVEQLSELNVKLDAALGSHKAEFAKLEKTIETRRREVAEYSKRVENEVPKPVEAKIKALFEAMPKPKDGAPGAPGKDGVNTDLADSFRGNWDVGVLYKRGQTFTFRGAFYLVLKDTKGLLPTVASQQAPLMNYAVVALSGAPGPAGVNGTNGSGGGSGLSTKVAMPVNTAAPGADGNYAVDGTRFAVYVAGTGWLFIDGYQV